MTLHRVAGLGAPRAEPGVTTIVEAVMAVAHAFANPVMPATASGTGFRAINWAAKTALLNVNVGLPIRPESSTFPVTRASTASAIAAAQAGVLSGLRSANALVQSDSWSIAITGFP